MPSRTKKHDFVQQSPGNPFVNGESNHPANRTNPYETNPTRRFADSPEKQTEETRSRIVFCMGNDHLVSNRVGKSPRRGNGAGSKHRKLWRGIPLGLIC